MFKREHIERFLSINGVSKDASEDEIKSILLSARWHKEDVEAAVLILRENSSTHETSVDSMHKVFHSDERMKPETVSALLGIEMTAESATLRERRRRKNGHTLSFYVSVLLVSIITAALAVLYLLWKFQIGFFHHAAF